MVKVTLAKIIRLVFGKCLYKIIRIHDGGRVLYGACKSSYQWCKRHSNLFWFFVRGQRVVQVPYPTFLSTKEGDGLNNRQCSIQI